MLSCNLTLLSEILKQTDEKFDDDKKVDEDLRSSALRSVLCIQSPLVKWSVVDS